MVAFTRQIFCGPTAREDWRETTCRLFKTQDVSVGDPMAFRGDIFHARIGGLDLSRVVSNREWGRRTARRVAEDPQDTIMLVHVTKGSVALKQGRSDRQIDPDTVTLYRANQPFEWQHTTDTVVRNIAIPDAMLRNRIRTVDQLIGRRFDCSAALWRVTSDFVASTLAQAAAIPKGAQHRLAAQIVDLVALSLTSADRPSFEETSSRAALHARCKDIILGRLWDDQLDPQTVADAAGLSVRSLHRLFNEHGHTVRDFITQSRLNASWAELANPASRHLPIAEIAARCGYRSPSHFATAFKALFGVTPRECRNRA
jgi:AraC-like DNA-binding protein